MILYKTDDNKFVLKCDYEQRELPKSAGFRWDGKDKRWWTDNPTTALAFKNFADDACKHELLDVFKKNEVSLDDSRASDAVIDVPRPEGLEYLPFQRAGIKYALIALGVINRKQDGT